jgi:hypothetical protein
MSNERGPANVRDPPAAPNGADPTAAHPPDPVPWIGSVILGVYFAALAFLIFYLLVATWPVSGAKDASGFADFSLFGSALFSIAPDHRLFLTVIAAGPSAVSSTGSRPLPTMLATAVLAQAGSGGSSCACLLGSRSRYCSIWSSGAV